MRRLLAIALPMIVSQASDTVMLFFDRLFVSRLGERELAACMSGGLTQFTVCSFFLGMVGYVNAIVAQNQGAGRKERCAAATFQAVLLSVACYPILLAAIPLVRWIFVAAGHEAVQVELEFLYFRVLMLGSVLMVVRYALTGFFVGIGRTTTVMVANGIGMAINVPANYVLIYGNFGVPAMGLAGAAIGTLIGSGATLLVLAAAYLGRRYQAEYHTRRARALDRQVLVTLIRFGAPAGVEMLLIVAAFNIFIQLMHSYGTSVAAVVTVAFNWDIVAFIPMLGMSAAVTSLVGQDVGAGDFPAARRDAYLALKTAWVYSTAMMVLFLTSAPALVRVFLDGSNQVAVTTAEAMLRFAGLYTLADSCQLVFSGALRGAGDTHWVMRFSVGLHWLFSALAVYLIRFVAAEPLTVWYYFIGFVVLLGIGMFLRFRGGRWEGLSLVERTPPAAPALETAGSEVASPK